MVTIVTLATKVPKQNEGTRSQKVEKDPEKTTSEVWTQPKDERAKENDSQEPKVLISRFLELFFKDQLRSLVSDYVVENRHVVAKESSYELVEANQTMLICSWQTKDKDVEEKSDLYEP